MSSDLTSSVPTELETRAAFTLHETAGTMWLVRSGMVELFTVRTIDGKATGHLRPLAQVGAGDVLLPLPHAEWGVVLARPVPGSEVVRQPLVDDGVPLERWIDRLSSIANSERTPRRMVLLDAGATLTADDHLRRGTSKAGIVWVRQMTGESRVLGRPELSLVDADLLYPVSKSMWIEVQPHGELAAERPAQPLASAECQRGFARFHADAVACIGHARDTADNDERARLVNRADSDALALNEALRELVSPLSRQQTQVDVTRVKAWDSPLMRACQTIGNVMGITFVAPAELVRGNKVKDPVAAIAQASGVRYRRIALKDQWLDGREPLLAFRDKDGAPVALWPQRNGRYALYDPELRSSVPLDVETAATLNPFAFMFYQGFDDEAVSARTLLALGLKGCTREIVLIVAVSMASGALAMLVPVVTGVVFDSIIPTARRAELAVVCALLLLSSVVTGLLGMARSLAVLRVQGRASLALQSALWDRLLSLPLPFFRAYTTGDLAQRSAAITQIRSLMTGTALTAIFTGVFSFYSFGMLFYYSPRLAIVATLMLLPAVAVTIGAGSIGLRLQREVAAQAGKAYGLAVELLTAINKFRVAAAEQRAFVLWVKRFATQKRADFANRQVATVPTVFNAVYVTACMGVLYWVNSGWSDQSLTTGQFLAFTTAFGQFMGSGLGMGAAIVGLSAIVPLYERAAPILQALPETTRGRSVPPDLAGAIDVNHVGFRYNADGPTILEDVSFSVTPGEYVAIVGPSGCGKSTLFRLLLGFETPTSGTIAYDGSDLSNLDPQAVRRQIGVVL